MVGKTNNTTPATYTLPEQLLHVLVQRRRAEKLREPSENKNDRGSNMDTVNIIDVVGQLTNQGNGRAC